ncbi:MAG: TRAP transporter permease, partial [Pseudomonadota bacterium]
ERNAGYTPSAFDLVLLVIALSSAIYPIVQYDYFSTRMYYVDDPVRLDYVFGIAAVLLILEATRRALGWALPATAAAFLIYSLLSEGFSPRDLVLQFNYTLDQLYLTTEGIFGIPLSVSATFIVLFILFGALVERSGAGRLFMDFALAIAGHTAGGPAKVACITSGLFGSVSGSAVANVMTTGIYTIPLMQRIGYRRGFAGAVEAVASTGGQIMPPIMGAAAFVMADFLAISYLDVLAFALFPAILYYVALFAAVHFEAKRIGMVGLPRSELPSLSRVLIERGHLFLPLFIIVATLLSGYSAPYAALAGIASVVPVAMLRKTTRRELTLYKVVDGLVSGARNSIAVGLACACAGIVVGCITLTNLGGEFTAVVIALSQNSLVLALILTMIAGIILGMGLPTTPAYIVQTALLVPALVKLGVMVEAAHMFVLYFAILSAITPPVAMAVFAANGISRGNLWDTGFTALKLGATGYIIPFMFVFGPSILLIGAWTEVGLTLVTATAGVLCLSAGMIGYINSKLNIVERLFLIGAAICLIKPGLISDVAGLGIGVVIFALHLRGRKAAEPAAAE